MKRVRTRLGAAMAAVALGASALAVMGGTAHALANPAHPAADLRPHDHVAPVRGRARATRSTSRASATSPRDNSMWVADDNGDRVWEIDPTTGVYKSPAARRQPVDQPGEHRLHDRDERRHGQDVRRPALVDPTLLDVTGTTQVDAANLECLSRTDDFESAGLRPDRADVLYVTSGNCCTAGFPPLRRRRQQPGDPADAASYPFHPTVWKLTRDGAGHFKPTQWQALPEGTDPTAAGLRPGGGHLLRPQQEGPDLQLRVELPRLATRRSRRLERHRRASPSPTRTPRSSPRPRRTPRRAAPPRTRTPRSSGSTSRGSDLDPEHGVDVPAQEHRQRGGSASTTPA